VLAACTGGSSGDDVVSDGTAGADALTSVGGKARLLYEGTCQFLHDCSSFSRRLPVGQVEWGCGGSKVCRDDDLWVAGPTRSQCDKHVKFCNGSKCVTATVRDVSVAHAWEASNGVLDALGLDHALTGKCSGSGGGTVSVTVGVPAPPVALVATPSHGGDDDDAVGSAPPASNDTDAGDAPAPEVP
jgi:hypothetical protein